MERTQSLSSHLPASCTCRVAGTLLPSTSEWRREVMRAWRQPPATTPRQTPALVTGSHHHQIITPAARAGCWRQHPGGANQCGGQQLGARSLICNQWRLCGCGQSSALSPWRWAAFTRTDMNTSFARLHPGTRWLYLVTVSRLQLTIACGGAGPFFMALHNQSTHQSISQSMAQSLTEILQELLKQIKQIN